MIDRETPSVRAHVDLFAFTLLTLSIGWLVMGASHAWNLNLFVQMMVVFIIAVLWTLASYLVLHAIKKVGIKMALEDRAKKANDQS